MCLPGFRWFWVEGRRGQFGLGERVGRVCRRPGLVSSSAALSATMLWNDCEHESHAGLPRLHRSSAVPRHRFSLTKWFHCSNVYQSGLHHTVVYLICLNYLNILRQCCLFHNLTIQLFLLSVNHSVNATVSIQLIAVSLLLVVFGISDSAVNVDGYRSLVRRVICPKCSCADSEIWR